jgi:hypothetical protein
MKYVFVNGRVAVIIRYWEQRAAAVEGGARVDIREVSQLEGEVHRPGAAGFSVAPVSDGGIWRADLFVVLNDGGTPCFHYHPEFRDGDVGDRFDRPDLAADPRRWIEDALTNLPGILSHAGAGHLSASVDLAEHQRALPLMMTAIDHCLARGPVAIGQWSTR